MEVIKRFDLDSEHYCEIGYDEFADDPRDWEHESKLCIRPHRHYRFPNELPFHFDNLGNTDIYETLPDGTEVTVSQHENKKLEGYHVFNLDCYEHGGIKFSLSGEGMQCNFDTSNNVGFIAIPIKNAEGTEFGYEEAKTIAGREIGIFNQYLNGEVYYVQIFKRFPTLTVDGRLYTTADECIDSFGDVWNLKDSAELLDEKFKEVYLANI